MLGALVSGICLGCGTAPQLVITLHDGDTNFTRHQQSPPKSSLPSLGAQAAQLAIRHNYLGWVPFAEPHGAGFPLSIPWTVGRAAPGDILRIGAFDSNGFVLAQAAAPLPQLQEDGTWPPLIMVLRPACINTQQCPPQTACEPISTSCFPIP